MSRVEFSQLLRELLLLVKVLKQLPSTNEPHYEKQLLLGLETVLQGYQERVAGHLQKVPLGLRLLQLLRLYELFLPHRFHGVQFLPSFHLAQHHFPVGAFSQDFDRIEALNGDFDRTLPSAEYSLALAFTIFISFEPFEVEILRLLLGQFGYFVLQIDLGCAVLDEGEVVLEEERHLLLVKLAIGTANGLDDIFLAMLCAPLLVG